MSTYRNTVASNTGPGWLRNWRRSRFRVAYRATRHEVAALLRGGDLDELDRHVLDQAPLIDRVPKRRG